MKTRLEDCILALKFKEAKALLDGLKSTDNRSLIGLGYILDYQMKRRLEHCAFKKQRTN